MAVLYNTLKDNFTQIPNALLTDDNLSMGAKVVYCYVASKPTGWKVWNKEIQQALNIKDNGTMSKYWKELLDFGWVCRTRTKSENGQFSGGYDYELQIEPKMDKNHIGEKPTLGKNPEYSNTDFNSNTNIDNNTNIISPNGQNPEELNNLDKPNNQLFGTTSKPKKKGENQFITVIQELSVNEHIRNALQKYYSFRCKRGLTIEQWQLMVEKFKQDSKGKTVKEVVDCIEQCVLNGRNSLYYTTSYVQQQDFGNIDKPNYQKQFNDGFDMPNKPLYDD